MIRNLRQRDGAVHAPSANDAAYSGGSGDGLSSSKSSSSTLASRARSHGWMRAHAGSVPTMISAIIGAGVLGLPFVIRLTGIVPGVLLLILSAYISIVSIDVIIEACAKTQLFKYEDVALRLAGKRAKTALEISVLISCLGVSDEYC